MLNSYARKVYSQNGEDGILEYLLNKCGVVYNKCLEIGVHDGTECNTANLIKNLNLYGLFIDITYKFNYTIPADDIFNEIYKEKTLKCYYPTDKFIFQLSSRSDIYKDVNFKFKSLMI